jgi:hypothetical protein
VDIDGHPPFPAGSKQLSGNFGNLLFLAFFRVLNFRIRLRGPKRCFFGYVDRKFGLKPSTHSSLLPLTGLKRYQDHV